MLIWEVIPFLLVYKKALVLEWSFTMAFAGVEIELNGRKQQYQLS